MNNVALEHGIVRFDISPACAELLDKLTEGASAQLAGRLMEDARIWLTENYSTVPDINGLFATIFTLNGCPVAAVAKPRQWISGAKRLGWFLALLTGPEYQALCDAKPEERDQLLVTILGLEPSYQAKQWRLRYNNGPALFGDGLP